MIEVRVHTNRAVQEFVAAVLRLQRITALFATPNCPRAAREFCTKNLSGKAVLKGQFVVFYIELRRDRPSQACGNKLEWASLQQTF
jgi:hypothetical protein